MDPEVAQLAREERLLEAAGLASQRGDARTASALFERACEWAPAAAEALRAGDAIRALELGSRAGDDALCEQALRRIAADAAQIEGFAVRLEHGGAHRWAARLLEENRRPLEAAKVWERAGEALRAAEILESAGEPAGAARVLEAALRRDPRAWRTAVALGRLLVHFGKHEGAVRVLQHVPRANPARRDALPHLIVALERLGLTGAAREAEEELEVLGGPDPTHEASERAVARAPGVRLFGRYDVVREIASSPSARVIECVDVARGERVAIKLFAAWDARGTGRDALARFEREARATRALEHPSVVPLKDVFVEGPAIVLAWMAGGTLERLLSTTGRLAPSRAIEIATSVLSALGDAHRLGILHRDVKPSNVLFDESGGARLSDFGVAHLGDLSTTATAGVFGTLAYMSPEQREGRPSTVRSDIFAAGVMLREMLTGERATPTQPPRLRPSDAHRELSPAHDAAVERLTAMRPEDRPADAFEARRELSALAWPATLDARALDASSASESRAPSSGPRGRLGRAADGTLIDTWTGRGVERVALSAAVLACARAFAGADYPGLQVVLRVSREDNSLWLEAIAAEPPNAPLTTAERRRLAEAVHALHTAGAAHGSIDRSHVAAASGGLILRFPARPNPAARREDDRAAIAAL